MIGGGQSGLSVGYHLARLDRDFVVLDAGNRVGDSWRNRWESLRLFTPASYSSLPGMPFPAPGRYFPTKDEMAAYLEGYAARFDLPIRSGARVDGLSREKDRYVLRLGAERLEADSVVVATGAFRKLRVPAFASGLSPAIMQLHSSEYRNLGQLREGGVLVSGAGNSGAETAVELASARRTWLSGRDTGHVPLRLDGRLSWWLIDKLLTVDTRMGRRLREAGLGRGDPLIRLSPKEIAAAGVERVSRTVGSREGQPTLADGRVLDVANVVWCTGFAPDFKWIDLPVLGDDGYPVHHRGVVEEEPGLYFVGLPFLYSVTSTLVGGVGRDAEYIAKHIEARFSEIPDAKTRPTRPRAGTHGAGRSSSELPATSKVAEQYDRFADSYDERWRAYLSGTLEFLKDRMDLSGEERVLDVACGTGEFERLLLVDHPALCVTGVDISRKMLDVARRKLAAHENVGLEWAAAEELPFPSGTFEVVVTASSFHYFDNPTVALLEMRRVLKPGGRAIVLDWCRDFLACRACDLALKVFDPAYRRCYDQRELRSMMHATGFRVEMERRIRTRSIWGMMVVTGVSPH